MNKLTKSIFPGIIFLLCLSLSAANNEKHHEPYTVATLAFTERGKGVQDAGAQVADLMFANLAIKENIWLVEREDLKKVLTESELNLSGAVSPSQAIQVGQLTGARIIITGSIFKIGDKTYMIAKVIGTETSRVLAANVNGNEDLDVLTTQLAQKVSDLIDEKSEELMPKKKTKQGLVALLKTKMGDIEEKTIYVNIKEEHIQRAVIDPAAETEFQYLCKELGFKVTDVKNNADFIITGEGFSEFASRHQNLISVKARLEVKITDRKGNVLAVDRQTSIAVDLAEAVAGKTALQTSAQKLALRILPKITK
jgi:TolB-like protein